LTARGLRLSFWPKNAKTTATNFAAKGRKRHGVQLPKYLFKKYGLPALP
jgi:hypothetical protein